MKKIINSLLCLLVIFGISGCGVSAKDFEGTSYTCKYVVDSNNDQYYYPKHKNHTVTRTFYFYEGGSAKQTVSCSCNDDEGSFVHSWKVDGKYIKVDDDSSWVFKIDGDRLVDTSDPVFTFVKDK